MKILLVSVLLSLLVSAPAWSQQHGTLEQTVDSLHVRQQSTDSLLRADSLLQLIQSALIAQQKKEDHSNILATQRLIDLTYDGKPEVLRFSGRIAKRVDDTKLTFTIKSAGRTLYQATWNAKGYFDPIDHLTDSAKRSRLRRIVAVFFANENFTVLDSSDFRSLLSESRSADLAPESPEACELFRTPRAMYSVFESRDTWYGLVWLPSKKQFVKAWRN